MILRLFYDSLTIHIFEKCPGLKLGYDVGIFRSGI